MIASPVLSSVTAPSPSTTSRFLTGIVRIAWRQVAEARPALVAGADAEQWIGRAAEVVERNIASGRFTIAPSYYGSPSDDDDLLPSYAEQVLVELLTESERLARLIEGDPASWRAVIERMERMAYFWLGPHGREEWAAWEARDATAHTCADLWIWLQTHPYPFDVPFDRWSARALNNRLHESRRKQQVRERWGEESLDLSAFRPDTVTTVGDRLADMSFDEWLERTANREALLQALALLKERMATVLRLWYLEQ